MYSPSIKILKNENVEFYLGHSPKTTNTQLITMTLKIT